MQGRDVTFLLVEDDDVDVMGVKRSFKQLAINNTLVVARNGLEGLAALRGEEGREKIKRPYIILLDLNMPKMNGIDFLDTIRNDPELKTSVVFVLTTSIHDQDRLSAYERNIAGYIVKMNSMECFLDAMAMIDSYWRVVELP